MRKLLWIVPFLLAPVCDPEPPELPEDECQTIADQDGDGCPEAVCEADECPTWCTCLTF